MIACDNIGDLALHGWFVRNSRPDAKLTPDHYEAARRNKLDLADHIPENVELQMYDTKRLAAFRNALSTGVGTAGGFSIPDTFMSAWELALTARPMRRLATVIRVASGPAYHEPMSDDSSSEGYVVGESNSNTAQDVAFAKLAHRPTKFHSGRVNVPHELEQDGLNFGPQLGGLLAARVSKLQNRKFTTGSGVSEPTGFITACSAAGATAAAQNAASIIGDDLMGLVGALGGGYLDETRCTFMMAKSTLLAMLKLKGGSGDYLMFDRGRLRILGFPIAINDHMPAIGTTNASVAFGDFSYYHVVDFGSARVMRDRESRADADVVGFGSILRSSGHLLDAGTHPIVTLVHP